MANVQSAFGLRHVGYISGSGPDYQLATRAIQSSNATKIFTGDPVNKSGAFIVQSASGTTAIIDGIFQGCVYIPVGGGTPQWSPFWPGTAAQDGTAYIMNAPNAIFLGATTSTAILPTNIGNGIGFTIGTGSTAGGGFSGATLDTLSNSTASPFQVYGMYNGVGNGSDTTTLYNWILVTFNNQQFKNLTGVT